MKRSIGFLCTLAMVSGSFAADTKVGPGSAPPALDVKAWFKGTPVTKFDKNKIYVVEFWATWCGPCKTSIPHLTELAKKNGDVTFIGVSIWEDNQGGNIQKFVDDFGDKMDYNVGWSGNKDGMSKTWMEPAGQNGIPSAFIIKDNKIQWIGHPMSMEEPLAQVKSGHFDLNAFKAKFDQQAERNRQQMAAYAKLNEVTTAYGAGKKEEAKKLLDGVVKQYPMIGEAAESIRFGWLGIEDPKAWEAKAEELGKAGQWQPLLSFAMDKSQAPNADFTMPIKAMEIAVKSTNEKDALVLYYAGYVYDKAKEYKKGVDALTKALAALPNGEMKDNADFKAAIEKLQKSMSEKAGG